MGVYALRTRRVVDITGMSGLAINGRNMGLNDLLNISRLHLLSQWSIFLRRRAEDTAGSNRDQTMK